jgi:hypothetical protein
MLLKYSLLSALEVVGNAFVSWHLQHGSSLVQTVLHLQLIPVHEV